jgi:hypothetical protein
MFNDHTKHMMNQLKYMLEDGLVKKFKTLNTSTDPYSVPGMPQAPSSSDDEYITPMDTSNTPQVDIQGPITRARA